eukprot:15365629-Alexandrium_andersonii.AAC.1
MGCREAMQAALSEDDMTGFWQIWNRALVDVYCSVAQSCGEPVGRQAARGQATLRAQKVVDLWARPALTGEQGEVQVMARQVSGSVKQ